MRAETVDVSYDVESLLSELETAVSKLVLMADDGTSLAQAAQVARERVTGLRRVVREARERDRKAGRAVARLSLAVAR